MKNKGTNAETANPYVLNRNHFRTMKRIHPENNNNEREIYTLTCGVGGGGTRA